MKSLMQLCDRILHDMSMLCRVSTQRDRQTIAHRVKHEGLSFLTITLPTYGTAFERWLDQGYVDNALTSFAYERGLPRFLKGFLHRVFDTGTGKLLDEPDIACISLIRQLTLMYKKILLPCSKERERGAYARFIQCEEEVKAFSIDWKDALSATFQQVSDTLFGQGLSDLDLIAYRGEIVPKHGPGATSERISGNAKYELKTWHTRLEDAGFWSSDFVIPNHGFYDQLDQLDYLDPGAETPVRVITVPKTLKTPRIIAIEPVCMQYTQQAILEQLVSALESSYFHGAIGFTDQLPNRKMAELGSIYGSYATIDLSDASDRVSNHLVCRMLRSTPNLLEKIQATRSTRADVPGYGVIPLAKFASMGSALCFPIEAMVFLTAVLSGIIHGTGLPVSWKVLSSLLPRVRVYGDDIIIPVEYTQHAIHSLQHFGMKVNTNKSFWTGKFRESCGGDFYDGIWVTPVYVRRQLPDSVQQTDSLVSLVSLRNQLYKSGLWHTVQWLDLRIKSLIPFPVALETTEGLVRHTFLTLDYSKYEQCRHLHKPIVKAMKLRHKKRKSVASGLGAMMKFFLKRGDNPIFDKTHLETAGRPTSSDTKCRWVSVT